MYVYRYVHRSTFGHNHPISSQSKPAYPYKTVGAVFNHESFYANCQVGIVGAMN